MTMKDGSPAKSAPDQILPSDGVRELKPVQFFDNYSDGGEYDFRPRVVEASREEAPEVEPDAVPKDSSVQESVSSSPEDQGESTPETTVPVEKDKKIDPIDDGSLPF